MLLNTIENYLIGLNITDDIQSSNLDELDQGDTSSDIHEGTAWYSLRVERYHGSEIFYILLSLIT